MRHAWFEALTQFVSVFSGDLYLDLQHRTIFATDASAYRELPIGVAIVHTQFQLKEVVDFCITHSIPIIPRGAGTSLGGQVVGNGLVLDTSHLKDIIKLDVDNHWVDVEPGVVLDELNLFLKAHGLFFGPETSTSSRCTIGGMVGNNSCGSHSLVYGSTRNHLIQVEGFLSDGCAVSFGSLSKAELAQKMVLKSLEGDIYRGIYDMFDDEQVRQEIIAQYPDSAIRRRNGGYALDCLINSDMFGEDFLPLNIANLIAGSEGTLMVFSNIRLNLVPLPPPFTVLLVVHFHSLEESLLANILVVSFLPRAVELMDKTILDLTKDNIEQRHNRFFIEGDPQALLIIELGADSEELLMRQVESVLNALKVNKFGYYTAIIHGLDSVKVWSLRKAGLGVLSNMIGDAMPVSVIEDCAVRVEDLPAFCADIKQLLLGFDKECVFHGHAGSGELHLRPILNLKDEEDVALFRVIAYKTALLVKKYRGSFSGEHGDGRVRGEFIPLMIGSKNYALIVRLKSLFDPNNILNPYKIIDTPPMNSFLRFVSGDSGRRIQTVFSWSADGSMLAASERCNGSADCLKSSLVKGVMCPSYQVTKNELFSPRGRANLVREYLTQKKVSVESIDLESVVESLRLCLSCKACKSECPSNVDVAKFKVELMSYYYKKHSRSLRNFVFRNFGLLSQFASCFPLLFNTFLASPIVKNILNISSARKLPILSKQTLKSKFTNHNSRRGKSASGIKRVVLFNDEFTNYYNSHVGEKALQLLTKLGYNVELFSVVDCGRTHLSMGDAEKAKEVINRLLCSMSSYVDDVIPIVGLEPSAILTFRDEALTLATSSNMLLAQTISKQCFTFEEFVSREMDEGRILSTQFTAASKSIAFHGHCYQKALETPNVIKKILSLPVNYSVVEINSGCCGMGGSFGYEKEHFNISKQIGELVLLPTIRSLPTDTAISTSGFSCKHQIEDCTDRNVLHPAEILFEALV